MKKLSVEKRASREESNGMTTERLKELFNYKRGKLYWRIKSSIYGKDVISKRAGSKSKKGHIRIKINGKQYMEHRLIYIIYYGFINGFIYHKNGINHDNHIENLIMYSEYQNQKELCNNDRT